MTPTVAWPPALAGTPAVAVIEQAIARDRLSHSLLLHGDDHDTLVIIAHAIADRLLNTPESSAQFPPEQHPDCFALRPTNKSRQISAEAMRELIGRVQVSPAVATHKVAILHEADRMHQTAANVFLKTLEEPPANTTLLLLTSRPYALLPTIRSRVLHFRFPSAATAVTAAGWSGWLEDYRLWLGGLSAGVADKRAASGHILTAYGLTARFVKILDDATALAWTEQKDRLPPELDDEEQIAIEAGLAKGLRARLFAEIERATRDFVLPRLTQGDATARRAFTAAVENLEHASGLLRLNLNEAAALEEFLLTSLRVWTKR